MMAKNELRMNGLWKLFQLKFYSFLSSRMGMAFCIIGAFISFNTVFRLITLVGQHHGEAVFLRELENNVGGQSYIDTLCAEPIDIVYTWVNGSDAKLIAAVNALKASQRDPDMPECKEKQDPHKHNCYRDGNPSSRYIDNQELRYSLRSIEMHAPWIRHIYLVTNGQIPSWLNLANPKISIVTHQEIFVNKSHLPTFSSPSIETHLHRIPGISKKFIYLNDDVMFGRNVYPDDFLTQGGGQRVFLSWPVPNCNDGCPSNWIGDGFCDTACNTTLCDFDGGDCNNSTGKARSRWWNRGNTGRTTGGGDNTGNTGGTGGVRPKAYCSRGCPDSWVGDKHCDRACKSIECGFDAGDCGVEMMFSSTMPGYEILNNTKIIHLPNETYSVYFNLSKLIGDATITDGSHDNAALVRTATISQKHKLMTLTFHRNIEFQKVSISITYETGVEKDKKTFVKEFNITLSTVEKPIETTPPESDKKNGNSTLPTTSTQQSTPSPNNQDDIVMTLSSSGSTSGINTDTNNNNNGLTNNNGGRTGSGNHINEQNTNNNNNQNNNHNNNNENDNNSDNNQSQSVSSDNLASQARSTISEPNDVNQIQNSQGENQVLFTNDEVEESKVIKDQSAQLQDESTQTQSTKDIFGINESKQEEEKQIFSGTGRDLLSFNQDDNDDTIIELKYKEKQQEEDDQVEEQEVNQSITPQESYQEMIDRKQQELLYEKMEQDSQVHSKQYRINRETERQSREQGEDLLFPWEEQELDETTNLVKSGNTRKTLDMFGDSLKFVNRLYSIEFGAVPRKVPAHMPHMIDRDLMEEMQKKWPAQWDSTSSHSLRNSRDMQYAFSYFYYLIHKRIPFDIDKLWSDEIDLNRDGQLSENEFRSFAVNVVGVPLRPSQYKEFKSTLYRSCLELKQLGQLERGEITQLQPISNATINVGDVELMDCPITLEVLKSSNHTMEEARKAYSKRTYYRTTIEGTDEVAFLMVEDNDTVTQTRLDGVRQKRHKFICLNDNINHEKPTAHLVIKVVHDFYESLFPRPSSFELPQGQSNQYLYIDDIIDIKIQVKERSHSTFWVLGVIITAILVLIYKLQNRNGKSKRLPKKNFIV